MRPYSEETLDAALVRVVAGGTVQRSGVGAEFGHGAEGKNTQARKGGQRIDGGANGARIGVVGVIEQQRTAVAGASLHAARWRFNRRECRGDRLCVQAERMPNRRCRERIAHLLHARQ